MRETVMLSDAACLRVIAAAVAEGDMPDTADQIRAIADRLEQSSATAAIPGAQITMKFKRQRDQLAEVARDIRTRTGIVGDEMRAKGFAEAPRLASEQTGINPALGTHDEPLPTPRWRVKDEQGDDLITFWRTFPAPSNEVAAADIIEELESELAEGKAALNDALRQRNDEGRLRQATERSSATPAHAAQETVARSQDEDVKWLLWQASMFEAGDDKFANRLLAIAERLASSATPAPAEALTDDVIGAFQSQWNEALEAAALVVDQCNREGPYNAIGAANRIRALKNHAPHGLSAHSATSAHERELVARVNGYREALKQSVGSILSEYAANKIAAQAEDNAQRALADREGDSDGA